MDIIYTILIEPFSYDFMQRALIMALIIGIACSVFSCFLVLKGWSLMGDAVSHAVLPGIALAYIAGLPLMIGALAAGLVCALGTGYVRDHCRVKEDAVMGIMFSGMFALGLVLLTKIETDIHLLHILFGSIMGLSARDVISTGAVAAVITTIMVLKRRDFMVYCFDPAHANVIGLNVRALHFGLLILLALTIVVALKAAGIILVVAMLIAPGATAYLITRSFDRMMMVAIFVSVFSCLAGTIISFHIDAAPAPLIVVLQSAFFMVAMITNILKQRPKTIQTESA